MDWNTIGWKLQQRLENCESLLSLGSEGKGCEAIRTHLRRINVWNVLCKEAEMTGEALVPYTFRHRYAKASNATGIPLTNISLLWLWVTPQCIIKVIKIHSRQYCWYVCQVQRQGRINMEKRLNSLKYFAPLVQIVLCPVTILFLWTVFTGPEVIPEINEELVHK